MLIHQSNKDEVTTFNHIPSVLYWVFFWSPGKNSALTSTFLSSPLKPPSLTYHHIQVFSVRPTHCPIPLLPSTNMDRNQTRPELEEVSTCDHAQDSPKRWPHVSSGLLPRKKNKIKHLFVKSSLVPLSLDRLYLFTRTLFSL